MKAPLILLFDLGGVLTQNSLVDRLNALLSEPVDSISLRKRWLFSPSVRNFELGKIAPLDFAKGFISEWGIQLTPEAFLEDFISWPKGFFPGARETIQELRKRYSVGCFSNSNPLHLKQHGNLNADFDITLFSHLLGVIKPDIEAFEMALEKCGAEPGEVCFFDDCEANVLAAQRIGMKAFHVDGGIKALQKILTVQGWLSS